MNFNILYTAMKLAYYVVLILYHGLDFAMDWYSFHFLLAEGKMSGVPVNSIAVKILFGFSCVSCTICTAALLRVYAHYIKYYYLWLYVAAFEPVDIVEGSTSIQLSDDTPGDREKVSLIVKNRGITVDSKYIMAELVISVAELTLKDDIQSGLLFWVSTAYVFTMSLSWHSLIFSICSLLAHWKLFICFVTKLFRLGEGEDAGDRSRWDIKCFYCVLGCIGSATFEGLTIAYLVKALRP